MLREHINTIHIKNKEALCDSMLCITAIKLKIRQQRVNNILKSESLMMILSSTKGHLVLKIPHEIFPIVLLFLFYVHLNYL